MVQWGGGNPAGRQSTCLWFLGNTVEICSIFKILVFPPATRPPFTPLPSHPQSGCLLIWYFPEPFQCKYEIRRKQRAEGSVLGGSGQATFKTLPPCQAEPTKTTIDQDMYPHPVQCGLGTVPTTHGLGGQSTLRLPFITRKWENGASKDRDRRPGRRELASLLGSGAR